MPSKKSGLSAAEYAILGLVYRQPGHGYQIAQELAPNRGLGLICPLRLSNVYFLLGNLEQSGLIEVARRQDDVYPPKTVFQVTAAGRRAFQSWIRQPLTRLRQVRLDFLLKVYFLRQHGVERILGLLDEQIEFCQRYVSEWKALVQSTEPDSFDCLAMQSRVAAAQGTLDWLTEYRQRLSGEASQSHRPAGARRRRSG
ncbi:MAG: PadR family transcriptional regulator [Dehalococcoidia bacterium]|nr:MAG: PadR family transcriptional regulator [Dehalococcoidia bacterium]